MLRDMTSNAKVWAAATLVRLSSHEDRRAVTAVEYAIIAGILAAVIVLSVTAIGPGLSNIFNKVGTPL